MCLEVAEILGKLNPTPFLDLLMFIEYYFDWLLSPKLSNFVSKIGSKIEYKRYRTCQPLIDTWNKISWSTQTPYWVAWVDDTSSLVNSIFLWKGFWWIRMVWCLANIFFLEKHDFLINRFNMMAMKILTLLCTMNMFTNGGIKRETLEKGAHYAYIWKGNHGQKFRWKN